MTRVGDLKRGQYVRVNMAPTEAHAPDRRSMLVLEVYPHDVGPGVMLVLAKDQYSELQVLHSHADAEATVLA